MLQWLRRRREAERLAQADAESLIRDHGGEAYREARERERDVILTDGTTHAGPEAGALAAGCADRGAHDGQEGRRRHGDADARRRRAIASRAEKRLKQKERREGRSLQRRYMLTIRRRSKRPFATFDCQRSRCDAPGALTPGCRSRCFCSSRPSPSGGPCQSNRTTWSPPPR